MHFLSKVVITILKHHTLKLGHAGLGSLTGNVGWPSQKGDLKIVLLTHIVNPHRDNGYLPAVLQT